MTLTFRTVAILGLLLGCASLWGQDEAAEAGDKKKAKKADEAAEAATGGGEPSLEKRIKDLEKRIKDLEKDVEKAGGLDEDAVEEMIKDEIDKGYARGIQTALGAELSIGGKLEINFVDTQSASHPDYGATDNSDAHLVLDRIRVEPRLDIGKKMEIQAQIDFLPDEGSTFLKEAAFIWDFQAEDYWEDVWWLRIRSQLGLDDNFVHIGPSARVTESYPLIGTAFWRDEEIALIVETSIGKKRGAPVKKPKKSASFEHVPRHEKTSSTTWGPFDFANNTGELHLYFSVGNGYTLSGKSVNKDSADLQEIIQDDRETEDGLALNRVGFGVGWERDFNWLGEIGLLGFFFEDELNDDSVAFLQDDVTERDGFGNPTAGYGDSGRRYKRSLGFSVDYHLEAYHFLDRWMDTWPDDGLYLRYQWIEAVDGRLERDGWYAQASYRFSFPRPLIADKYVRYIEPVVRYGEFDVDRDGGGGFAFDATTLPLTWDREELVFGAVLSVTEMIFFKAEYQILDEDTGDGDPDNDTLIVQLLVEF